MNPKNIVFKTLHLLFGICANMMLIQCQSQKQNVEECEEISQTINEYCTDPDPGFSDYLSCFNDGLDECASLDSEARNYFEYMSSPVGELMECDPEWFSIAVLSETCDLENCEKFSLDCPDSKYYSLNSYGQGTYDYRAAFGPCIVFFGGSLLLDSEPKQFCIDGNCLSSKEVIDVMCVE